jgi:hypothetical protein
MIEIIVRPVVDCRSLCRQAVPIVEIHREQSSYGHSLEVTEIMAADLARVV